MMIHEEVEPSVGEKWFIKEPDKVTLACAAVIQVTCSTITFRSCDWEDGSLYGPRVTYKKEDVEMVEEMPKTNDPFVQWAKHNGE